MTALAVPRGNDRHILRDAAILVGLIWLVMGIFVFGYDLHGRLGDAWDYWSVNSATPYTGTLGAANNFAYSPPLAIAFSWLGQLLPFGVFAALWTGVSVAAAIWLVRPKPWLALVLALPLWDELWVGQIELLMALAIVLALRAPGSWALPALAKPTSAVGVLWFAARREWRSLAISLGTIGGLALASYLVRPDYWTGWLAFLSRTVGQDSQLLPVRVGLAAGLVVCGARTGRRWTVLVAAVLALPVIYIHSLAMLVGVPRLLQDLGDRHAREDGAVAEVQVAALVVGHPDHERVGT